MMEPTKYDDVAALVDAVIAERGTQLKVAFPLGLGKPVYLANELVKRAVNGEIEELEIYTALSLSTPGAGDNDLQQRLMEPILDRLYEGVPDLDYVVLRARGELPDSIRIHEFYYPPGALLASPVAQRHYQCVNFTDAFEEMKQAGLDLIGQMVAPSSGGWDLSCNTDLSLELFPKLRQRDRQDRPLLVAQVNRRLPPMEDTAVVEDHIFDMVLDDEIFDHELFGLPSMPVSNTEYAIGLRVASLLRDGGTVQIGIGGLGDALSWAALLRHEDPSLYGQILVELGYDAAQEKLIEKWGGLDSFDEGLYASTEMFVEGLLHMIRRGVVRREVDGGVVLHGAFYLGSSRFYELLRHLDDETRSQISMESVRFTNLLYGDEDKKRRQRRDARFINSAMMVTGLGAVVSDGLEDGRVVSGVGGQYEFIAMANALEDGRSIVMLPATRESGGEVQSNIVWKYAHCTIPRHLRDIVVTEYGIADLRGKSDEDIVKALVGICDARFQADLVRQARKAGKLADDWKIPASGSNNTPGHIDEVLSTYRKSDEIQRCPFGSALTEVELDLVQALQHLKKVADDVQALRLPEISAKNLAKTMRVDSHWSEHLMRMGLFEPSSIREQLLQRAVVYGLKSVMR